MNLVPKKVKVERSTVSEVYLLGHNGPRSDMVRVLSSSAFKLGARVIGAYCPFEDHGRPRMHFRLQVRH
jgi:hypothetical protein